MIILFELLFIGIIILLLIILFFVIREFLKLRLDYSNLLFDKRSQSIKYGQLTEQWIPFSSEFPYNPQNFRFVGKPIDGISFEEDKIVFVEFKSNKSQLSESQRRIRDLVRTKKVEWFELKIE